MMEIVFSRHAKLKLGQRKISRELVLETIDEPEFSVMGRNFREELHRRFGQNYLKVVVEKGNDKIFVITAHWVAKFKYKG